MYVQVYLYLNFKEMQLSSFALTLRIGGLQMRFLTKIYIKSGTTAIRRTPVCQTTVRRTPVHRTFFHQTTFVKLLVRRTTFCQTFTTSNPSLSNFFSLNVELMISQKNHDKTDDKTDAKTDDKTDAKTDAKQP
jgi:hypothetical protein